MTDIKVDYEKMTVVELKDILREKGLKTSGNKDELIQRLKKEEKIPLKRTPKKKESISPDKIKNVAYLEKLPLYVLENILVDLPLPDLNNVFAASKNIKMQYDTEYFWTKKLKHDFSDPGTSKEQYKNKYVEESERAISLEEILEGARRYFNVFSEIKSRKFELFIKELVDLKEIKEFTIKITKEALREIFNDVKLFNIDLVVKRVIVNVLGELYEQYEMLVEKYKTKESLLEKIKKDTKTKRFDFNFEVLRIYPFVYQLLDDILKYRNFKDTRANTSYNRGLLEIAGKLAIKSNFKKY